MDVCKKMKNHAQRASAPPGLDANKYSIFGIGLARNRQRLTCRGTQLSSLSINSSLPSIYCDNNHPTPIPIYRWEYPYSILYFYPQRFMLHASF